MSDVDAVYSELRNSLDTLRLETDKQANYHLNLAKQVKDDLETQTAAFCAKQAHHKKTFQAAIEKEFKNKQTQESYVNKAREKYESDCLRINSYTAQSTLVQGKDLEKINLKLERAQQTVQANERDFANFARALADTVRQWEADWKAFCDSCQDMEEERMEFVKDNMWAYANAVSTVCVNDDEVSISRPLSILQLMAMNSLVRCCEFRWSNSNLNVIWRTSSATMAQAVLFPIPLISLTIPPKMPSLPRLCEQRADLPLSCGPLNALAA
jgi:hypothetical protein